MIADVVFDLPVDRPFSYRIPPELAPRLRLGQRVTAPLRRRSRLGVVVALRDEVNESLESLIECADPVAFLSPTLVDLTKRVAGESLTSWGSACAAFLPPPRPARLAAEVTPVSSENRRPHDSQPILLIGENREERLVELFQAEGRERGLLLAAPEIEDAEAWTRRLSRALGVTPLCLHSGRPAGERYRSWLGLAAGRTKALVTTRAGLLAPIPAPAVMALVDEHDPAHKSPASPRFHARDVAQWRANAEGHQLFLTSATPSVESWWRAQDGQLQLVAGSPAPWLRINVVDLAEADPDQPFSGPLRQAVGEVLAHGGQVLLLVMRLGYAPVLACAECGFSPRCAHCRICLTFGRQSRQLRCHLCRRQGRAPALCPRCRGRRLTARGWGTERVEEAARAALPGVRVVRYDGESARGTRGVTLRRLITRGEARVIVGTRSALRLFPPGTLGAIGVISPDPVLRLPDFRGAERTFQLLWEAAERVGRGGGWLIVQTHYPDHYAITAVAHQDLATFYRNELKFRAELGYPPFSRLTRILVQGKEGAKARALSERINRELGNLGAADLTIYGPAPLGPAGRSRQWQLVVKGDRELPVRLRPALMPYITQRSRGGVTVEVDMDPLELV